MWGGIYGQYADGDGSVEIDPKNVGNGGAGGRGGLSELNGG